MKLSIPTSVANKPLTQTQKLWMERRKNEVRFDVNEFCFDKQLCFINDPHPFATAVCSVRAGKTVACAADLIRTARARSGVVCLYITLSRSNGKKIIWPELCAINSNFRLGGKINESDLSITFPNNSKVYVSGAGDRSEVEKFRGLALALCYIDECQSFRDYIRELVDEVIAKRLFDYAGKLRLIGTPGPVPVGYFYECSISEQWSHHKWTMFDNPWLPKKSGLSHDEILDRELKRKGVTRDDPSIQRECFGQWAFDPNALVFRYSKELNDYDQLPVSAKWSYVFGIDLGYDDADAIAVIAWSPDHTGAYLVYEDITTKQGITGLAKKIEELIAVYNPDKIVMDTGGLGKKIAEEIQSRYGLPIVAAEKSRKFEFIEILNDAMRTKRFFAKPTTRFAADCSLVEWDKDSSQPKVKDAYHSDICDSVLYAMREAFHWLYESPKPEVKAGTAVWLKKQEDELEAEAYKRNIPQNDLWDTGGWK